MEIDAARRRSGGEFPGAPEKNSRQKLFIRRIPASDGPTSTSSGHRAVGHVSRHLSGLSAETGGKDEEGEGLILPVFLPNAVSRGGVALGVYRTPAGEMTAKNETVEKLPAHGRPLARAARAA